MPAKALLWLTDDAMLLTVGGDNVSDYAGVKFVHGVEQSNWPIVAGITWVILLVKQNSCALLPFRWNSWKLARTPPEWKQS